MGPDGDYSEDALVEQPAIALFRDMGWEIANARHEFEHSRSSILGRDTRSEVVLVARLRTALHRLNPNLPAEAVNGSIEELTRDRGRMSPAAANREVYKRLREGVQVKFRDPKGGGQATETVRVIDWADPRANDFLLVSQFSVTGETDTRRADLVGFVNGLPLVFVELKAMDEALKSAYDDNLRDYRNTIPQLFWYNALVVLSNGHESRVGSVTAKWEHFGEWKRVNDEDEPPTLSLETTLRATCEPSRLLDIVENFTIFQEATGGLVKLVARNHQYLGVNRAIAALQRPGREREKLGVFWHTQGSGKSVSMIFFAQKVLRKLPGNWSFVVVTDRKELDEQIHGEFESAGVVTEGHVRATGTARLRQLLAGNHRYIFTLIHKFRTPKGQTHPELSQRSDIIVIADEAHRSQYDTLATNMRTALPNAAFIAFTGTPLIAGEELTRQEFGDYVSVYDFRQSVDDHATVPLYYESRKPELQLTNEELNEDIYAVVDKAELDDEQEAKLARRIAQQYHLITRDERLEEIARDLVGHFMGRGFRGKAMVVSIDRATAVRMYDKVQRHWGEYLEDLRRQRDRASDATQQERLEADIRYMDETDMAVVVSAALNEEEDLRKKGAEIAPHRQRMESEDLATAFKDDKKPFRIVFVCSMWMTGFDVPSCSTVYLDKPMRNHTLMQTIARANRVWGDKQNGLIVDYVGVFRKLQTALAIYAPERTKTDPPIKDVTALVARLKEAIAEVVSFLSTHGVDLQAITSARGGQRAGLLADAKDALLETDEIKSRYRSLANDVVQLLGALMPHPAANEFASDCAAIACIARMLRPEGVDISEVEERIARVLDASIAAHGYLIAPLADSPDESEVMDLSKVDWDAEAQRLGIGHQRTLADMLRRSIAGALTSMVRRNRRRLDYLVRFQQLIKEYNAGSLNAQEFVRRLRALAADLTQEERRHVAEKLSEEELAVFDILTKPEVKLTKDEREQVKGIARDLLAKLRHERFVLDWRERQETRAGVQVGIKDALDGLPPVYTPAAYEAKVEAVYQHVYEAYWGDGGSVYGEVA